MERERKIQVLVDLRRVKGTLWNGDEVANLYNLDRAAEDIDSFLYFGYDMNGPVFLRAVRGRFGSAFHDEDRGVVFLCRDWVGEVPLHYYLSDTSIIVANSITDIQSYIGPEQFRYEFVRAVPHSHVLLVDAKEHYEYGEMIRRSWHVAERTLYYDFEKDIHEAATDWNGNDSELRLKLSCRAIHTALEAAVRQRLATAPAGQPPAVLLSGGIDSLSVAYFMSQIEPRTVAYTLSAGDGSHDVVRAEQIAKHLGLRLRKVKAHPHDLTSQYPDAVRACELYHLPNVYCASGMLVLGKALREDGIAVAFCGEGANEALGDYHDWEVLDPATRKRRVLQRVDFKRLAQTQGRVRYVWGQDRQEGRYNLQLGSGLAKHGVGRMVKPLLTAGVQLECPYLDQEVMCSLVPIPYTRLTAVGGKPGLMARVFRQEIKDGAIPEAFFLDSQKVRLQDGSDLGEGGLTQILLREGFNQERTISIFNDLFGAHLIPQLDAERLSHCSTC